ncbi:unnamed protein product [Lactuca saligna]|uniref:SAM domain-containing protein n=1 Tax=Lactuca saligna TaxID=75948 RepID=A0AA35YWG6_LACSI|nr:unnamed protein product [Lactuca saligna]
MEEISIHIIQFRRNTVSATTASPSERLGFLSIQFWGKCWRHIWNQKGKDGRITTNRSNFWVPLNKHHLNSQFLIIPNLSSKLMVNNDIQQNIENDDPNFIKPKNMEIIESKPTQKCIKGPRSKRCRRTVFETPWTPSMDNLYGSNDNQGSGISKKALRQDVNEPTFKIQKGVSITDNLESNDIDLVSESSGKCVNSVGRWLEDVGFGRYADVFEMHEVDEEALPLLTLDDLKEMGVLAVGPRRKLYAAISRLRGESDN